MSHPHNTYGPNFPFPGHVVGHVANFQPASSANGRNHAVATSTGRNIVRARPSRPSRRPVNIYIFPEDYFTDPYYIIPRGLLNEDANEQRLLLQHLDKMQLRRPCQAAHCLRARSYKIIDSLYIAKGKENDYYKPEQLFISTATARPFIPSSSDSHDVPDTASDWEGSSNPSSLGLGKNHHRIRPPHSPRSIYTSATSTSAISNPNRPFVPKQPLNQAQTFEATTRPRRPQPPRFNPDVIHFYANAKDGSLLSDLKTLKKGYLVGPEDDIMGSWGVGGSQTWLRIAVNQHGYEKKTLYALTRCNCANITRAGLAFEIASLLEQYFTNANVRHGYQNDPLRRKDINAIYIHALRRNLNDPLMQWRVALADSSEAWYKLK